MKRSALLNKKGTSIAELIAYVALMGIVMTLLMSIVLFVSNNSKRIFVKSTLNTQSSILYESTLSFTTGLDADTVTAIKDSDNNVIGVEFFKKFTYYNDERVRTEEHAKLKDSRNRIQFIFDNSDEDTKAITVKSQTPNQKAKTTDAEKWTTSTINLKGVKLSDVNFRLIKINESNTYVNITGNMSFQNKTQSFNYTIPVFTTTLE